MYQNYDETRFSVAVDALEGFDDKEIQEDIAESKRWNRSANINVKVSRMTQDDSFLDSLIAHLENYGERSALPTLRALKASMNSDGDVKFTKLDALPYLLSEFLRRNAKNSWLFPVSFMSDEASHPVMITKIGYQPKNRDNNAYVYFNGKQATVQNDRGNTRGLTSIEAREAQGKTMSEILRNLGYVVGTQEMFDRYESYIENFRTILLDGYRRQYLYKGRKVVNATNPHDVKPPLVYESPCWDNIKADETNEDQVDSLFEVPVVPHITIFNLVDGKKTTVDSRALTLYEFDPTLYDKIVLPKEQRDMIDMLTDSSGILTHDIIEGKSAGNIILCKGKPGVGKTLTAEVYSEVMKKPLYSIRSGQLGTTAQEVHGGLTRALTLSEELHMILLIDEADVFIRARGNDLTHNSIVAEFLRVLEYHSGMVFLTTNRGDEVDDAILSRCSAFIEYHVPEGDNALRVWKMFASLNEVEMSDEFAKQIDEAFPGMAPRDIKNFLRLAVRFCRFKNEDLSMYRLVQVSNFRGITYQGSVDIDDLPIPEQREQKRTKVKKRDNEEKVRKATAKVSALEDLRARFKAIISASSLSTAEAITLTIETGDPAYNEAFSKAEEKFPEAVNLNKNGTKFVKATNKHEHCPNETSSRAHAHNRNAYFVDAEYWTVELSDGTHYVERRCCFYCGTEWVVGDTNLVESYEEE